ncbi:TPA: N-acetyl sugar amidotransferase [bacterium]|nr:N-acetyl sugar amidotransferase [bacterium]
MDTSDQDIRFDENGYCNHCRHYFEITSKLSYQGNQDHERLNRVIEKIKIAGRNSRYDCLVGISGGVDSCYTAYIAKKMGLRVLVTHMDNGWDSEAAVKNIKYIVNKLGLDYESYVLNWEEFRDLQLAFLKASVPEAETPTDIAILAALHRVAAKNNIKYIISGGNYATEGILPQSWHYDAKDLKYLKAIQKRFGTQKLKSFPTFGFFREFYYKFFKGIRIVYLLNYMPYSKKEAKELLEKELDWKYYGGKHHESFYTKFIQSFLLYKKFGIDYRRATYSTMICTGEMNREDALSEINNHKPFNKNTLEDDIQYLCKKLEISRNEFDEIMALPPKYYYDYPNNKAFLELLYSWYRKFKGDN